ncbi:MAG: DUF1566 domain-containing protein [Chlorobium sp.]
MMKHFAKRGIARLWMVVLLAGLSMVTVSAVASAVNIGDEYGGGIVFYVDGTGQHGLVAAKADFQEEMNWDDAKSACESLVSNSYSDWFLPNKEQLKRLYNMRSIVGGFSDNYYWNSTEDSADYAWNQSFYIGYQNIINKSFRWCVRTVRVF